MRERKYDDAGLTPKEKVSGKAKSGNEGTPDRIAQSVGQ